MRFHSHFESDSHGCLSHHRSSPRRRLLWGIALMAIGAILLLNQIDVLDLTPYLGPQTRWWHFLALLFALGGAITVVSAQSVRSVFRGLFKIVIGLWAFVCLEQWWGLTFAKTWPIVLMVIGLRIVARGWFGRSQQCVQRVHDEPTARP